MCVAGFAEIVSFCSRLTKMFLQLIPRTEYLLTCTIPPIYQTIKKSVLLLLEICKILSTKILLCYLHCEYSEVIQLEPLINTSKPWLVNSFVFFYQMGDLIKMTSLNMVTSVVQFNYFKPDCSESQRFEIFLVMHISTYMKSSDAKPSK